MSLLRSAIVATSLAAVALAGCGRATPPPPEARAAATVPATLFASAAPAGAVPLLAAKEGARAGDRIVFEARVGGRRTPFVESRAVFFVADPSLASCDRLPGDTCKYPWDYCCEPPHNLRKHIATVQVVDGAGQPLETSLENHHGLAPLKTIYVSGTVQSGEPGNFVVEADTIYVEGG